jgi:hypothetical protein
MNEAPPPGVTFLIHGFSKHGKALALETPVPTPRGWSTIGELQAGDELFNDKGQVVRVAAIGPIWHERPCRRIQVKGDVIIADAAHVWRAGGQKGDNRGASTGLYETDELVVSPGSYRTLPWTPELQLPEIALPVDPYVLGVWLGDGAAESCYIGDTDERKLPVLQRCLEIWGDGEISNPEEGHFRLTLPGLRESLTRLGARYRKDNTSVSRYGKLVPSQYLRAGTEQRRELLAGLMDTDGEFTAYRAIFSFSNTNIVIAEAVAELAHSLGIRAQVLGPKPSWTRYPDGRRVQGADHYRVPLRGVVASHRITHRPDWVPDIPDTRHKHYNKIQIESLEEVPSEPVRCIQVDDAHGMFLVGKSMIPTHNSWLGDTTPGPRLVLDAETGSRFTPSRKIMWDPIKERPPKADGTWDTAIVPVRQFRTMSKAYEWLAAGEHDFSSVVMDSLSEVQTKILDDLTGINAPKMQDYGQLLRVSTDLIRKFRDLVTHPSRPVKCVMMITMTKLGQDNIYRPLLIGQLASVAPYLVDCEGFMVKLPQEDGSVVYRLLTGTFQGYETGDRLGGQLGEYTDNPRIEDLISKIQNNAKEF